VKTLYVAEAATLLHVPVDEENNRRARKMRTQIATLRRLAAVVITVIAVAAILMTFDTMRAYGASVLASAGVAGVVAGLAAQTTLANVFAGLQLVFTDAARIDDVIVVEDEWGRIEELTLTYVVVHLWDERRLILPSSYFTTKPFQNWTRAESRVLGAVVLHVDPTAPIAALRNKAREVIEAHPLWDRRDWALQVVDTTETTLVVRVLASAADAPSAWDLRCDVREQLVAWLQSRHPAALPRLRTQLDWPTVDVSRETSGFTRRQPPVP
jgi:small-conductance mechanosensitive channel